MISAAAICAFLFTTLSVWQITDWLTANKRRVRERLSATFPTPAAGGTETQAVEPRAGSERRRFRLPTLRIPGSMMARKYLDRLQTYLLRAGVPLKAEEMVVLSLVSGLAGFFLGTFLIRNTILSILTGIAGLAVPGLWVGQVKRKRITTLESQLLDSLVMMTNSLRAGHSFLQGIELVSREMDPPLATEFGKLLRENRMGVGLDESLMNLVNRVDSPDLELVVTGVMIQRQVGGNLAQVLENTASTIEKRIKTRARIRVATAQGRISAWIVSLLPFGLGFMVFGMYPDFGSIMLEEPIGVAMLAGGVVLLAIGVLIIRKVVNIDV